MCQTESGMSRKSLPKTKKEHFTWFNCEKCNIYTTSKNHSDECLTNSCDLKQYPHYIHENVLYLQSLNISTLTADSTLSIKNLVFINETVLRIIECKIGDSVLIKTFAKSCESEDITQMNFVRIAWPLPDTSSNVLTISREGVPGYLQVNGVLSIEVKKLDDDILSADEILLSSLNTEEVDESILHEVRILLKKTLYNNVYSLTDQIKIDFFNKTLNFRVESIQCRKDGTTDDLSDAFSNIKLTEKFYQVKKGTVFKIQSKPLTDNTTNVSVERAVGLENVIEELTQLMQFALGTMKINSLTKLSRGVLLHGPSGCGKSLICRIISQMCKCPVVTISTSEIFSKYYGESEANLTQFFDQAFANHPIPTVIIVEDVKNLCPKSSATSVDAVKRITSLFSSLLDSLQSRPDGRNIFLLATVDNPDNLNATVRRSGRLDCEIEIPVPDSGVREQILCHLLGKKSSLSVEEIREISKITHGFVGSDLISLVTKASMNAVHRSAELIQLADIDVALKYVKPSAMREVLIESPNVRWTDIGGQADLKLKLKQAVEWPITHPEVFIRLGIRPPRGVLMFGPPGCSKTLIAKALATESKLNFLSIKGPELFSMWVGESERAVRELFRKARQVAPSIIFFDEIDAIGSERSAEGGGSSVKERVLAQILTELDGVNALNNVVIVAATNRPDLIDKALLRPGRIDRIIYVQLPDLETRAEIFKIKLARMAIADDVNIEQLAQMTGGYSGAEIQAVCNEAALRALEENVDVTEVEYRQFKYACEMVRPRTNQQLLDLYEKYLKEF